MNRSISNIIAVLGLMAIASITVVIGYTIMSGYMAQSIKPNYDITISYAKMVLITENEMRDGDVYSTFKVEVGVSNPGSPTTLRICVVSASQTNDGYTTTRFPICPEVYVEPGYNVYSLIVRIPNSNISNTGCGARPSNCPVIMDWRILVEDQDGTPIAIVKPVYVIP